MAERNTFLYRLTGEHGETLYIGTTNDPERREQEHRNKGWRFRSLETQSCALSKESAATREQEAIATYKRNHDGKRPKYNKNDSGK